MWCWDDGIGWGLACSCLVLSLALRQITPVVCAKYLLSNRAATLRMEGASVVIRSREDEPAFVILRGSWQPVSWVPGDIGTKGEWPWAIGICLWFLFGNPVSFTWFPAYSFFQNHFQLWKKTLVPCLNPTLNGNQGACYCGVMLLIMLTGMLTEGDSLLQTRNVNLTSAVEGTSKYWYFKRSMWCGYANNYFPLPSVFNGDCDITCKKQIWFCIFCK